MVSIYLNFESQIFDIFNTYLSGNPMQEDRYLFCEIHHAETSIVPDGIQKGYPMEINFELLEARIIQMKDDLLDIIYKRVYSYYRDFSLEICKEVGPRKAGTPMALMNRFEELRVSIYTFIKFIIFYINLYLFIARILWFKRISYY
jgi:hypothetical protein